VVLTRDGTIAPTGKTDPRLLEELAELKKHEEEIRKENDTLMRCLRTQRKRFAIKEVLANERHQLQIDNLK